VQMIIGTVSFWTVLWRICSAPNVVGRISGALDVFDLAVRSHQAVRSPQR